MKIFLTLFVLLFSSSVVAELPISLFGIQINDHIKNYDKNYDEYSLNYKSWSLGSIKETKNKSNEHWFYPPSQTEKIEENPYFQDFWIWHDNNFLVTSIIGEAEYPGYKIDARLCIEEIEYFSELLMLDNSSKKDFDIVFYKSKFIGALEKEFKYISYEKKIEGSLRNKKYTLKLSCNFNSKDDEKYGYAPYLSVSLQTNLFERTRNDMMNVEPIKNFKTFAKKMKEFGYNDFVGL